MCHQRISFLKVLVLILLFSKSHLAQDKHSQNKNHSSLNQKNKTAVEKDALEKQDKRLDYFLKDETTISDAQLLFYMPELTNDETDGYFSNTQTIYRELGGTRFSTKAKSLLPNSPITELADANSMFLFAAQNFQNDAQYLTIDLPIVDQFKSKAVIGFGSQNAFKFGTSTQMPITEHLKIFTAFKGMGKNGRFSFTNPDLTGNDDLKRRKNNDQHRVTGAIKLNHDSKKTNSYLLLLVNAHEGGIPGFASSPTKDLRSESFFVGADAFLEKKIKQSKFSIDLLTSVFKYRTHDIPKNNEQFLSSAHKLSFGFKSLKLPSFLDLHIKEHLVLENDYHLGKSRFGGGFSITRIMRSSGFLKPMLSSNFGLLGFHEYGLVFNKNIGLHLTLTDYLQLFGNMMRRQRLPTFMEMHAKNNFFEGRKDLKKESLMDFELGSDLRLGQHTHFRIKGFVGFLSETIVYVQTKAKKLRPINATSAQRYGLDLALMIKPVSYFKFETKNSFLKTKIKKTHTPLPNAPSFFGLTKLVFLREDILALTLQSRYRGSTTANLSGTLQTNPYGLFDAIFAKKFLDTLSVSLSIKNIFNVKTAQDSYDTPLEGTTIFTQLEVGNV